LEAAKATKSAKEGTLISRKHDEAFGRQITLL
jgi:hypothetical protein